MATSWADLSEIVFGLAIKGDVDWSSLSPDLLVEPYSTFVRLHKKKKDGLTSEKIIENIGIEAFQTSVAASKKVKELPANWLRLLQTAANNQRIAVELTRAAKDLQTGNLGRLEQLKDMLVKDSLNRELVDEIPTLDEIKIPKDYNPFRPSGYSPIDRFIGGIPEGLTVIAAPPGTGKTFLALKLLEASGKKKEKGMFFSIEQTSIQIAHRASEVMKMPKAASSNISIVDYPVGLDDIVKVTNDMVRNNSIKLVVIDFAELIIEGDTDSNSESYMSTVYRTLAKLAKRLQIKIVLLAQMNRANYTNLGLGGIRYTGAAEQMAALILFLMNPSHTYSGVQNNTSLVALEPGHAGIVVAKSRFGFKMGGPIVIEIKWTEKGWDDKATRHIPLSN